MKSRSDIEEKLKETERKLNEVKGGVSELELSTKANTLLWVLIDD